MAAIQGLTLRDVRNSSSAVKIAGNKTTRQSVKILTSEAEFAIGWNRFNLSLIGLWPDQTSNDSETNIIKKYSSLLYGLCSLMFAVIPQILAPTVYSFILDELVLLVANVVGEIGAVVKIFVLWNNGEVLTEDWTRDLTLVERELMTKKAKISRNISIVFSLLMLSLVSSYFVIKTLPLFSSEHDPTNATDLGKKLLYPSTFPFELTKRSNFAFVWVGQAIAVVSTTVAYTGTDCFVAMLVVHLCGQMAILRHSLATLLDNEKSLDSETFGDKLTTIVKRHETLISLSTVIEDTINLMLLILTFVYTVQFIMQLYGLITAVTEREEGNFPFFQILFFVSYFNVTIAHLFIYCYVGEMLIWESEAFGLASYSCKWYNLSGRDAKDLLFLMYRARAPLQISAGKFVAFSLEFFGNVLKTSVSYFSVLITMKEQSD